MKSILEILDIYQTMEKQYNLYLLIPHSLKLSTS